MRASFLICYGFGQTVDANLFHGSPPRPFLLYVHATVFSAWISLYAIQSPLVRSARSRFTAAFYSYRFPTQRLLPFHWLWESAAGATVSIIGGSLFSSCVLTSARFGRFPIQWPADHWFYAGVDCLILTGVWRDILMQRTPHTVYRIALPALIALQLFGAYVAFKPETTWIRIANWILR